VAITPLRLPLAFTLGLGLLAPVHAAETSPAKLQKLIADLGYEPTVADDVVTVDPGPTKPNIKFSLNADHTFLNIYANWRVDAAKAAAIPAAAMLKANSGAPFAFATFEADGSTNIDLEASYDVSLVGKTMLRKAIDQLLETAATNEALWNQDRWTAGAAPDSLDAAQALLDAAWDKAPMRADHAMLTTTDTDTYGAYTKRPTASFKTGETVFSYFEPKNYARKLVAGDTYAVDFAVDTTLMNAKGEIVFNKKDQAVSLAPSHVKRTEFMFALTFTFGEMPSGTYTLTYTVRDANSAKSVEVALPLTIVKPS
jgi:hypothetical protein